MARAQSVRATSNTLAGDQSLPHNRYFANSKQTIVAGGVGSAAERDRVPRCTPGRGGLSRTLAPGPTPLRGVGRIPLMTYGVQAWDALRVNFNLGPLGAVIVMVLAVIAIAGGCSALAYIACGVTGCT